MLQSPGFNKDKKIEAVVNLMATGDNLYHQSVISDGKQKMIHMIIIISMKI